LLECEPYLARKATIKSFDKAMRASSPLQLIYSDICRPMNGKAHYRAIYFISLMDDYSQYYGYVYLLSHRYEALDVLKHFIAEVELN